MSPLQPLHTPGALSSGAAQGNGARGVGGRVRSSLLPVYPALPSVLRGPSSHRPGSWAAAPIPQMGRVRLQRLAGLPSGAPEPTLLTRHSLPLHPVTSPGGKVKGGGGGKWWLPSNHRATGRLTRSLLSPHPAHPGVTVLGSLLKTHPGSACPTHREPGGGDWEEGRGQREESLVVPGEDKAESSSWALGEGQGSPGQAGPRAPPAEGTGGAEASPRERFRGSPSAGRRVAGGGHSPPARQCPTAPGSPACCPPSR